MPSQPAPLDYTKAVEHVGHHIVIETYGNGSAVAIECLDCYAVIADADRPDTTPTETTP